jgi:formylmethanofuran dehydrogenase subunit E
MYKSANGIIWTVITPLDSNLSETGSVDHIRDLKSPIRGFLCGEVANSKLVPLSESRPICRKCFERAIELGLFDTKEVEESDC